jgi:hypothetical protein
MAVEEQPRRVHLDSMDVQATGKVRMRKPEE